MPSQPRPRWLEVEQVGGVSLARLTPREILAGPLVEAVGDQLFSLVEQEGCRRMLLSFRQVKRMSTPMIAKLMTLNKKLQTAGGRLALCAIDPELREVFDLCKVGRVLPIYQEERQGLESLQQPAV